MSAVLSRDGLYRFELRRRCGLLGGKVCWIMFNPSTADSETNDPTIRRCMDFSQRWGYAEMIVVNLLPLRSSNPKEAMRFFDGPPWNGEWFANLDYLQRATVEADRTIAAWGSFGSWRDIGDSTRDNAQVCLYTLGLTKTGQPRHPLYVPRSRTLEKWL